MSQINRDAMLKLSYGLFVLTAKDGKDNGCIINTVSQVTDTPLKITVATDKSCYTHDMIKNSGLFNVSVLTEDVPFEVIKRFGFVSGREADKLDGFVCCGRTDNGLLYLKKYSNAVISGKVREQIDCGTHTLFIADVTEAFKLSDEKSVTYQYYFDNIKPKPETRKKGYICRVCGYIYEGEELPSDYICPICKHPASDFEALE